MIEVSTIISFDGHTNKNRRRGIAPPFLHLHHLSKRSDSGSHRACDSKGMDCCILIEKCGAQISGEAKH